MTQNPSIGRIVHYVLANGQHRAAIVVNAWPTSGGICNLTVFLDHANDFSPCGLVTGDDWEITPWLIPQGTGAFTRAGTLHVASAHQDEEGKAPGTWHFPERE